MTMKRKGSQLWNIVCLVGNMRTIVVRTYYDGDDDDVVAFQRR